MGKMVYPLPKKFKTRREQILHYIVYSGEVPMDLYEDMNIGQATYKNTLVRLKEENIIKHNATNRIRGYSLSTYGKRLINTDMNYCKYSNYYVDGSNDIQKRLRMRNFATIYATLDKAIIPYEPFLKLPLLTLSKSNNRERVCFYNASEYKKLLGDRSDKIKGSKSYGLLSDGKRYIPVYRTTSELTTFSSTEFEVIVLLNKLLETKITDTAIFCSSYDVFVKAYNTYLQKDSKEKYELLYYDNYFLIPTREHFKLQMWMLFKGEQIKEQIKKQYKIYDKTSYVINDGFIEDSPVVFQFVLNIARLTRFMYYSTRSKNECIIVCWDYMVEYMKQIIPEESNIKILSVKSQEIERMIENAII